MGKIDLGLDFIGFGASGSRGPARSLRLTGGTEACTHLFRFMVFERTGMALLLSNSDLRKYIENRFAFNFQLPCQIVDSNLAHPPFRPPDCPAKSSYQPHGVSLEFRVACVGARDLHLFRVLGRSRLLRGFIRFSLRGVFSDGWRCCLGDVGARFRLCCCFDRSGVGARG